MKIATALVWIILLCLPAFGLCASPAKKEEKSMHTAIRLIAGNHEVIIDMFDNPASSDFLALLPLTLEFSDYANTEKIATLPRKLNTQGSPTAKQASGDFTYYAPWGNLAFFYRGSGSDGQLYVLGRIRSGKEHLAAMHRNFTARIENFE